MVPWSVCFGQWSSTRPTNQLPIENVRYISLLCSRQPTNTPVQLAFYCVGLPFGGGLISEFRNQVKIGVWLGSAVTDIGLT